MTTHYFQFLPSLTSARFFRGLHGSKVPNMGRSGFTLVELLAVISIIFILAALVVPAFNSLKNGNNATSAAYEIRNTMEQARSYAMANNTYVWVGFYEEDAEKPRTAGVGRIVMTAVASKDGTKIYAGSGNGSTVLNPTSLSQLGKLIKLENTHLADFPNGTGDGAEFSKRPTAGLFIGSTMPSTGQTPLQYPVGTAATAQYTFIKTLQFNPRGEVRLNDNAVPLQNTLEIKLEPSKGNIAVANDNPLAVQISGIAGGVKIYQR